MHYGDELNVHYLGVHFRIGIMKMQQINWSHKQSFTVFFST